MEKYAERAKRHSEDISNAFTVRHEKQQMSEEKRITEVVYNHMKREKRRSRVSIDAKVLKEKNEARMKEVKERLQELKREDKI